MGFFTIEKCYITEKGINQPKEGQFAGHTFRSIVVSNGKTMLKVNISENYPDVVKIFDSLVVSDPMDFGSKVVVYKVYLDYINNKFVFSGIEEVKIK